SFLGIARCLPPSLHGQQSSGTSTQSLSVLQSAVEAGAFFPFLAWATVGNVERNGTPNEATPSTANANKIRNRDGSERDMVDVIAASPTIRKSDPGHRARAQRVQFAVPGAPIRAVIATTSAATRSRRCPTSRV